MRGRGSTALITAAQQSPSPPLDVEVTGGQRLVVALDERPEAARPSANRSIVAGTPRPQLRGQELGAGDLVRSGWLCRSAVL
jgi:hypothetical protein